MNSHNDFSGFAGTQRRADPDLIDATIVPTQALPNCMGLVPTNGGELACRIVGKAGWACSIGVAQQHDIHRSSFASERAKVNCAGISCTLPAMKLYGTVTSPFVRRVRVVASELGIDVDRIDTTTDAGQLRLAKLNPIRKVPAAEIDGRTLFDSRVIIDWLTTTRGWGSLTPARDHWREQNLLNAIDGAVEAAISLFYLKRDGVAVDGTPYALRQNDRIASIFAWLSSELCTDQTSFRQAGDFGVPEISIICMMDWMDFRNTYATATAPALCALRNAWRARPSLTASMPTG